MRKRRWIPVILGVACMISAVSAAEGISLHFSGHLASGQGTCQQVTDSRIACRVSPGSPANLELTAMVSPADYALTIGAWELPPWVSFEPASGYGTTSAYVTISPPASSAGQTITLVFTATTAYELQAQLEVQLAIGDAAPVDVGQPDITYDVPTGEATDQGIEFGIPFLPEFSTFALGEVVDCETGTPIHASDISTEFTFSPTSQPPYQLADLAKVIVSSPGYSPHEIAQFEPLSISLFFIRLTLLMPTEPDICLSPISDEPTVATETAQTVGIRSIRLLAPAPGEGLEPSTQRLRLCWECLGITGATYEVFHVSKECDPDVVNGPHPFARLIPDPALRERRQALRARKTTLEAKLGDLEDYCPELAITFAQIEQRLRELAAELAELEAGRDAAENAQAGPFELPLPSACSRDITDLLQPHVASFDDIEPCQECTCRELADRLAGIIWTIQSLDARASCQAREFERLLERWISGADHRGVFEVYHAMFSAIDDAIQFVNDILDELTPSISERIQETIESFLTDAACAQSPDWCAAIEAAQTVRGQLEAIRGLMQAARTGGTPSPAFMVQMIHAMAQQAAAATAVAVEGWQRFAEVMGAVLWDAYESALCAQAALSWLLDQRQRIQELCEACRECVAQEIAEIDAELREVAAEEAAAAEARQEYWQEQLGSISSGIEAALALLGVGWYDKCCAGRSERIEVPGENRCAQQIEEALKQTLGDKACFLSFVFECHPDGGVTFEHSFPLAERRPCCCVPCARQRTPLGSQPDPGQEGESVCHPVSSDGEDETRARVDGLGPGGWEVEAHGSDGQLIASSPRRELGPGAVTRPFPRLPDPAVPVGCTCSVSVSVNGAPTAGGSTVSNVAQGAPTWMDVTADCGPDCDAGIASISIQPPLTLIHGPTGFFVMPPLPVSTAGVSMLYDFPEQGVYTVTATQTCEDGQRCTASFFISVSAPPGPVLRAPHDVEEAGVCPTCANDACLELAYRKESELPFTQLLGGWLILDGPSQLALLLASDCRVDCVADRHVRWEISEPSGEFVVVEGPNRYEIEYPFMQAGEYTLCVIETVPCPEGELLFEKWLVVVVSESE